MSDLVEFFAQVRDGDIVSITQATPLHELKENQIGLTKEQFFLLKSVHGANGNLVQLAMSMLEDVAKKIGEMEKSQ